MPILSPGRRIGPLLPLIALLSLFAVGFALVSQHVFDMQPCPWCILQRVIFLAIAAVALVFWLLGKLLWTGFARLGGLLVLLLAGSGVAAALYQHQVASKLFSCDLTLADRFLMATGLEDLWPFVFKVTATCADAAVQLWGLSYELWSGALFVLVALMALWVMRRP